MDPAYRATALFLAANIQAALFIIWGYWGAQRLEELYPAKFPWGILIGVLVFVLIVRNYYVLLNW